MCTILKLRNYVLVKTGAINMSLINRNSALVFTEDLSDEVYSADVLLNATICCCRDKEFRGEYYGIPEEFIKEISNERNEYLSLMTILSDKIRRVIELNQRVEQELALH